MCLSVSEYQAVVGETHTYSQAMIHEHLEWCGKGFCGPPSSLSSRSTSTRPPDTPTSVSTRNTGAPTSADYLPIGEPGKSPDRAGCINLLPSKR